METMYRGDEHLEDSYWHALLAEGEVAHSVPPQARREWEAVAIPHEGQDPRSGYAAATDTPASPAAWSAAVGCLGTGEVCTAQVVGYNRGGLLVDWNSIRGFVPASHLVGISPYMDEEARKAEFAHRVGWNLCVKVIEVDAAQGRLILSERATASEESRREALWEDLCEGAVRRGYITNVCDFGAFVDLGGLEGLIHISEISWGRVNHPADVLHSGDTVEVYVISVDRTAKRVALSLKRLRADPWATVAERYTIGQQVTGVITNVVSFGAFMRVEDGLEGLIHVSELAEGQFLHPRNVVSEGDTVTAHILNIDGRHRRLGLSLRTTQDKTSFDHPIDSVSASVAL